MPIAMMSIGMPRNWRSSRYASISVPASSSTIVKKLDRLSRLAADLGRPLARCSHLIECVQSNMFRFRCPLLTNYCADRQDCDTCDQGAANAVFRDDDGQQERAHRRSNTAGGNGDADAGSAQV